LERTGQRSPTMGLRAIAIPERPRCVPRDLRAGRLILAVVVLVLTAAWAGNAHAVATPDLAGTWKCCGAGGAAAQNFVITSGTGALAGTGELPGGSVFATITGSVSGSAVTIVTTYNSFSPGYVATFVGTLSTDQATITGSWTSNVGQSGTWTATRSGANVGGRVIDVTCTPKSCKRVPSPNVVINGLGPGGVTATATTDTTGNYTLTSLASGSWKIEPQGEDFDPDFRTVTVGASVSGQDFERCRAPGATPAATTQTLAAVAAPLCPPDEIDWLMEKRFTKASVNGWDADGLPPLKEVNPTSWTANLYTRHGGAKFVCGANVRFIWSVKPAARLVDGKLPKVGCKTQLHVTHLGKYTVTAQMQRRTGQSLWRNFGNPVRNTVDVRDWLIAGVGDSNGSGEGNPKFYYPRCNRSVASYQVQTALAVELKDPHSSVTFIHTACSGARIEHLVGTRYAGTRGGTPPLPPQMIDIQLLLNGHRTAPKRKVDVVLMSIGVNDLAFGPTLSFCVEKGITTTLSTPCDERKVKGVPEPGGRRIGSYVDNPSGTTLAEHLLALQNQLEGRYGAIDATLPRIGVRRDHVFLAQYPDFTHGDNGASCEIDFGSIVHMLPSTWAWLSTNGDVLNGHVKNAAAAGNRSWVVPDYDFSAFLKRGYCSTNSLFRSVGRANVDGDLGGPFHPTAEGHLIEAAGTIPAVCRKLYNGDETCNEPKT
jgi:GDSL-like Lipase/Acylhydrolase family